MITDFKHCDLFLGRCWMPTKTTMKSRARKNHLFCFEGWCDVDFERESSWCETKDSQVSDLRDFKPAAGAFPRGFECFRVENDLDVQSGCGVILLWHFGRKGYVLCNAWHEGAPVYPLPSSHEKCLYCLDNYCSSMELYENIYEMDDRWVMGAELM